MKTSVIICEFNPLHTGHVRLINFAKSFCDKVICVMSGNFVQRGMPACAEKRKRALHALKAGADLVIELPIVFATSAAENFAFGGVKIADALGSDYLVFGSECGDIERLKKFADAADREATQSAIKANLATGMSYPKAVAEACGADIATPNNMLGAEYLRAIKHTSSKLIAKTITRENNYESSCLYASSSALRADEKLRQKYTFDYVIPDIRCEIEDNYKKFIPLFLSAATAEEIGNIADVTEGLENRIFAADKTQGFEKMTEEIKTKRYTRTKIQRILLNCALGITKAEVEQAKKSAPKIHVLAVAEKSAQMLEGIIDSTDKITEKADRLFAALSGEKINKRLVAY